MIYKLITIMVLAASLSACKKLQETTEHQRKQKEQQQLRQASVDYERLKDAVATCETHGGLAGYQFNTAMSDVHLTMYCMDGVKVIFK